ncbi:HU family DNA-binding protein [Helicobacter marmotae]|uniref:HU family DNA-binding protein n=1 Tax=Helicobacter marmotae TaxID=152490 RepID=A0A3D8I7K9_9HELI|nr:HU family DNA-binding protein [Helicobacter marmotae]RDU60995.1 HU family DNA-binding protein [Helicobacter marmotae]
MNKAEFVELVKEVGEYDTKKDAEKAVNSFIDAISNALAKKQAVELVGFGKFETAVQKAKTGKVPGTNKTYTTKEKAVPKFRPGKGLKDQVSKAKK